MLKSLQDLGEVAMPRKIREGDLVVVYERFDCMKAASVTASGQYNSKWGNFAMKDWIGRPFGSKVQAKGGGGWAYILAPTPELWTLVLRHRTQILYLADISLVCLNLELCPGSVVIESGTGSGSLTSSLARAVAPTGHVHTFEFHKQRAEMARAEFAKNGLDDLVTVEHRNVEQDGFPEALHGKADAVFLDLPGPWKAVPSAVACLKGGGKFCSFSPCIEQVQRTCRELNANGFREMKTLEVLLREFDVSSQRVPADISALLEQQQSGGDSKAPVAPKRQKLVEDGSANPAAGDSAELARTPGPIAGQGEGTGQGGAGASGEGDGGGSAAQAPAAEQLPPQQQQQQQRVSARPITLGRGHTGYLTFARKAV